MGKCLIIATVGTLVAFVAGGAVADKRPEQVTVEAARILTTEAGQTYAGIPVKKLSLSYEVSLDDLDLSSSAGVAAAEKRVNNAAQAACKEIGHDSPFSQPSQEACAKAAADRAIAKVHALAAAAAKPPAK